MDNIQAVPKLVEAQTVQSIKLKLESYITCLEHKLQLKTNPNVWGTHQTLKRARIVNQFYSALSQRLASGRLKSAMVVARLHGRGSYMARQIRKWAGVFEKQQYIPSSMQGKTSKRESVIDDEAVKARVWEWIRTDPKTKRGFTCSQFMSFMNAEFQLNIPPRTARRWLSQKIRLDFSDRKKGIYSDDHERGDILEYRNHDFLPRLGELEPFMDKWEDGKLIRPVLPEGKKRHVLIVQDESAFHSNDDNVRKWCEKGKQAPPKKDRGSLVMVSDFMTAEYGSLKSEPPGQQYPSITPAACDGIQRKFLARMSELEECSDDRAKLLCAVLKMKQKWAGSSLITFLGKGVGAMLGLLSEKKNGKHTHDLDLYRVDNKSCDILCDAQLLKSWKCIKTVAGQVDKLHT